MKRSGFNVMSRLVGLVKPLTGYMLLAITMGLIGHLCATFITVFGGFAVLHTLRPEWSMSLGVIFAAVLVFALVRGYSLNPLKTQDLGQYKKASTSPLFRNVNALPSKAMF